MNRIARLARLLFAAPLKCVVARRRTSLALLLLGGALAAALAPELLTGRGRFLPLSPQASVSVAAALAGAGYELAPGSSPVLHRRWLSALDLTGSLEGTRILFAGRAAGEAKHDLRLAVLVPDTACFRVARCVPVRPTPSADERAVVPLDGSVACLSALGGGRHALTVTDGLASARRQFLFTEPGAVASPAPSPLAPWLVSLSAETKGGRVALLLDARGGAVHPPGFPVEFTPADEGDEPFLPWLVDAVRGLPFVGARRIAWLEDVVYGAKDRLDCALHAGEAEPENAPVPPEEPVDPGPRPSLLAGLRLAGASLSGLARDLGADGSRHLAPLVPPRPAPPSSAPRWVRESRAALGRAEGRLIAAASAAREWVAARVEGERRRLAARPADLVPLYRKSRRGEGVWQPLGPPAPDGVQALYKTMVRVDPARPFAEVTFASLDLERVELRLVGGTQEPISTNGLKGRGVIPKRDEVYRSLVCSFNGGFRTKHGKWGFIVDGVPYVEPVEGIATLAVDDRGVVHLGAWGRHLDPARDYITLRQNLPLLLEDGKFNAKNKQWGFSVNNETHIWRSGVGLADGGRRLVYAAGRSLTAETLARAFLVAGCDRAMELDVNDYHTYMILYETNKRADGSFSVTGVPLRSDMKADGSRNLAPYTRDFFYVLWKEPLDREIAEE